MPVAVAFCVSQGEARHPLLAFIDHQSVLHGERIEDRLLQELGVALAGNALDDLAQHDIGGIAVFKLFSRGKAQFLLAAENLKRFRGGKFVGRGRTLRGPKVVLVNFPNEKLLVLGETRGVMQQVADGDGPGILRKFRAKFGEGIVELQLVPFNQDHDGHGRELLCDRGQKELRVGRDGGADIEISKPENFAVLDPPIANEQRGHSRRVLLFPIVEQGVQARGQRLCMNADAHERGKGHASRRHSSDPARHDGSAACNGRQAFHGLASMGSVDTPFSGALDSAQHT